MGPKDVDGMANSVDPDHTVCPDLSVRKRRRCEKEYKHVGF